MARIYEVNPLVCTSCGKEIKIICFVTHSAQIWRILKGIGWPTDIPEFDPEDVHPTYDLCQLVPGTKDGFSELECQALPETGPDPPCDDFIDSPHWEDYRDPPHWED